MDKYEKLAKDLEQAHMFALNKIKEENIKAEGSFNMDALLIDLPRWQEKRVEDALKDNSIRGYKHSQWSGTFVFNASCGLQSQRTCGMEYMRDFMKELGYHATVMYIMD